MKRLGSRIGCMRAWLMRLKGGEALTGMIGEKPEETAVQEERRRFVS